MERKEVIEKVKEVIKYWLVCGGCGLYFCRNMCDDPMETVYNENGIQIDICYAWNYFEIFGLEWDEKNEIERFYEEITKK